MAPSGPVLLVDDDAGIRKVVARTLNLAGIDVVAVPDGSSARAALDTGGMAMVLLDVNLPDVSGLDLVDEIHDRYAVPVVVLSIVDEEADIVRALEAGADDYIRKPFSIRELTARVQAVLRRSAQTDEAPSAVHVGDVTLDKGSYRVRVRGEMISLTPTEYRLLSYMARNPGVVLTHNRLLTSVWGPGYEGETHMLHVTMSRLRRKLATIGGASLIRTTPGVGYEFVADAASAPVNGDAT
ncbi:MAG: response regulator transcription factor [Dehalococcoidia bacterium]|nr:MAG: response regulator transcription factor [Dehalococcoidia bacterium]